MKIGYFALVGAAAIAIALSGAGRAQPAPREAAPGFPAAGTIDCSKAASKAMPACVQDKGINLRPPPVVDPEIRRAPPPTGDSIANPSAGGAGEEKKSPR